MAGWWLVGGVVAGCWVAGQWLGGWVLGGVGWLGGGVGLHPLRAGITTVMALKTVLQWKA